MTDASKTAQNVREKVEAAKARLAERTGNARPVEAVKGLIEEHPVASLAAGILLGALIARAIPSRKRSTLGKKALGLATLAGKLATDYAAKAAEAGREGIQKAEAIGGSVSEKLSDGGTEARRKAVDLADIALAGAREASELALRKVNDLASKLRH